LRIENGTTTSKPPTSTSTQKAGSIFPTLDTLTAPLNQFDHINPPADLIITSSSANFNESTDKNIEVSAGLQATAAYGVAGSGELVYIFARDKQNIYHCDFLETTEFSPTTEFVAECVRASLPMQTYLENAFVGRKRVYMVTGPKIATGFSQSSVRETQYGHSLKIGVDATPLGAPVQAGPEVDLTVGERRPVAYGKTVNKIVFAYRVIRVKMKWDGETKYRCKSGGKYGVSDEDDSNEDDEEDGEASKNRTQFVMELLDEDYIEKDFPGLQMSLI
jgi:hypothetical protein